MGTVREDRLVAEDLAPRAGHRASMPWSSALCVGDQEILIVVAPVIVARPRRVLARKV